MQAKTSAIENQVIQVAAFAKSDVASTTQTAKSAIVIGAGIAGLLTARVLSEHFTSVRLIERDELSDEPKARKGIPQGHYVHQMLMRGRCALEALFPGLEQELIDLGAVPLDWYGDLHWLGPSGWMTRSEKGFATWSTSRDLLEFILRRRVLALDGIELLAQCDVLRLETDKQRARVCGVHIHNRSHEGLLTSDAMLQADLVIDASGRSSHAPTWLAELGYDKPQETVVNAFVGYASRIYRAPQQQASSEWKALVIHSKPPTCARSGTIFPIEGGRWIVTLTGAQRDYPPGDESGFLEFARSLRSAALYDAIFDAEPISSIHQYRRTENRWRHYEKMREWPQGFAVVGDALCSFNPVYGQGMTVAAVTALLLQTHLRAKQNASALGPSFRRELVAVTANAWTMSTGVDFRYPGTEGAVLHWYTRLVQRYMDQVLCLAAERPDVYRRFLHVMHMMAPPTALFAPPVAIQVMTRWVKQWFGAHKFKLPTAA